MEGQEYPENLDVVWLALDKRGQLGAFITAGEGPIPADALRCSVMPIEEVEAALLALPKVATADLRVSVPRPDGYIELAERGLFVYDWTDVHRKGKDCVQAYELVAVPGGAKLNLPALSPELRSLACRVMLRNGSCGDTEIDVLG